MSNSIYVNFNKTPKARNSQPHMHDTYELYFLLDGTRETFCTNRSFLLPPKSFYVFEPFQLHQMKGGIGAKANIRINNALLSEKEIRFLQFVADGNPLSLDGAFFDLYCILLEKLAIIKKDNNPDDEEYTQSLIKTLLYFLQQQNDRANIDVSQNPINPLADRLIFEVASYLFQNYPSKITLKDLSKQFFLSKVSLCDRFKKQMNCSIMEYLLQLRISTAKEQLISTNKSMEQISEACGFSSANYFGLVFKKYTKMSPLQFRKSKQSPFI